MATIERLDHVALLVRDVVKSAACYCDRADMEVVHERDDGARVRWVRLKGDPRALIVVMIETGQERPSGYMDHWGFHVPARADVDAIADRAREAGVLHEEPRYAGPVVGYYCIIRDPDGNELEFSCEQLRA